MADDLSWIDHPANLRANAVLLRAVADQSLLHADEIERLTAAPDGYLNKDDLIADLRNENDNLHEMNAKLHDEIERLRAALAKSCREDRAEFLGGCGQAEAQRDD